MQNGMRLECQKRPKLIGPYRPCQGFLPLSEEQWKPSDLCFGKIIQVTEWRTDWMWARGDLGVWTVWKANEVVQDDGNLMERMMERIHAHRFRSSHSSLTRQLNRHRAGFVMTRRHPSASPENSLQSRDWGWSALTSVHSSKALSQDQKCSLEHLSLRARENPRALVPMQSPPIPCSLGPACLTLCDYRFVS